MADLRLDLERAAMFSEIWAVLTPEQQAALGEWLAASEARVDARVRGLLALLATLL